MDAYNNKYGGAGFGNDFQLGRVSKELNRELNTFENRQYFNKPTEEFKAGNGYSNNFGADRKLNELAAADRRLTDKLAMSNFDNAYTGQLYRNNTVGGVNLNNLNKIEEPFRYTAPRTTTFDYKPNYNLGNYLPSSPPRRVEKEVEKILEQDYMLPPHQHHHHHAPEPYVPTYVPTYIPPVIEEAIAPNHLLRDLKAEAICDLAIDHMIRGTIRRQLKTKEYLLEKDLSNDFQRLSRSRSRSSSPMTRLAARAFKPVFKQFGGGKKVLQNMGFSQFTTTGMNPYDEASIRRVFNSMDTDHSSTIDFSELQLAMEKCNSYPSKPQLRAIMKEFDVNQDGQISFEEFKDMVQNMKDGKYETAKDKGIFGANNRSDSKIIMRQLEDTRTEIQDLKEEKRQLRDQTGVNQEINESMKDEIYDMKRKLEQSRIEQDRLKGRIQQLTGSGYRN